MAGFRRAWNVTPSIHSGRQRQRRGRKGHRQNHEQTLRRRRHRRHIWWNRGLACAASCIHPSSAGVVLTIHSDHSLVESGPYQHVRHPLYAATIGVFVGIGAVLGNWFILGLAGLPTLALIHRIKIEEDMLLKALGPDYLR